MWSFFFVFFTFFLSSRRSVRITLTYQFSTDTFYPIRIQHTHIRSSLRSNIYIYYTTDHIIPRKSAHNNFMCQTVCYYCLGSVYLFWFNSILRFSCFMYYMPEFPTNNLYYAHSKCHTNKRSVFLKSKSTVNAWMLASNQQKSTKLFTKLKTKITFFISKGNKHEYNQ